jgi:hypothetical protein
MFSEALSSDHWGGPLDEQKRCRGSFGSSLDKVIRPGCDLQLVQKTSAR